MRLKVSHTTEYEYLSPLHYALQRIRLTPRDGYCQTVLDWKIHIDGALEEVRYRDHYDNDTRLLSFSGVSASIKIRAEGEVETRDTDGIAGPQTGFAPLWFYRSKTTLTTPGEGLAALAAEIRGASDVERLHNVMNTVRGKVAYVIGTTDASTTAEMAYIQGKGVCQDHSHIFVAVARLIGYPARYVSGYLMLNDRVDQVASHAWAEAYVDGLGWVSFDPSNGISTDERYVRIACGRDYRDAMPISGITFGQAEERLDVRITVEQ
jgi:transglutaminase-like putative cysteine protease